ncbi:MAG: tetratricopeptide repeat protein [Bacteroidia bacterium]|nr:tetratricopeptide repeat protein [Bacteroidia bacterium]
MMKLVFYLLSITVALLIFSSSEAQTPLKNGMALYQSKKIDEANKSFKSIEKSSSDYAAAQYYLGRIAYDKKQYDDAVDYFESATEVNPNSGDYFNWLGDSYAAIGADASFFTQMSVGPKALKAWEKATKLDSKNINARASLVGAYMQAPGFMGGGEDKAKAVGSELLTLLDEALKTTPDNYLYHYWYGKSSAITGLKLDRGEASLKKYLTHTPVGDEPSLAAAYMRLGQITEKQGNKPEARKHFEMALKLDPKMKSAQEGLERTSK